MSMQSDVKSVKLTATGAAGIGRARVRAVYIVPTGTAGSVSFKDGGSGGAEFLNLGTVASATAPTYLLLPGEGVLSKADPYLTFTNVTSVTFFYS